MDPIAMASSALNIINKAKQGLDDAKLVVEEAEGVFQEIETFELTIGMIPRRGPAMSDGAAAPPEAAVAAGAAEEKTAGDDDGTSATSPLHRALSAENVEAGKEYVKDAAIGAASDFAVELAESAGVPVTGIMDFMDLASTKVCVQRFCFGDVDG
jgi:hypothetical protein